MSGEEAEQRAGAVHPSTTAAATADAYRVAMVDALRPLADPIEIQSTASRLLGRHLGASRVAYFEVRGSDYVVARDFADGPTTIAGTYPIASFGAELLASLTSGQTVVCGDVARDAALAPAMRDAYAAIQIGAHIGVPLIKGGQFVAGLAVHAREPRLWSSQEVALVEETAERTWAAVERARSEQALRESEEKYRTLFEAIDEGFCLCEMLVDGAGKPVDYRFLEVNPLFERKTGLKAAVGKTALELVPGLESQWIEVYGKVALTGESARFEQGSEAMGRWFEVHAYRVGEPGHRRFAILFQDITERRKAQAQLARASADLRESKSRFDLVKDGAKIGFWFCDLPFDVLIWDDRVKEHFWLPPDAEVTIETFYRQLHPDDREPTRQAIEASIANRTQYDVEYRTLDPGGREKWIRAIGRTFYDARLLPLRFDGVTLDITDRKHAEAALIDADRRKDEFLAMLAHELRNPLAPIRNATQVLKVSGADQARQQWARDVIERQTQHITRLVDDLLDVSRITQGLIALRREHVELSSVLERAIETNRPLAEARGQELAVMQPAPLQVDGDPTRLVQVLSNLINNAIKFSDEGGRIAVSAARDGADAVVRVVDQGMGIPRELIPHVFDLFTQADRSLDRSQGGLGIGLTLVRLLVDLHGGSVEARSDGAGRGAEFVVRLPLAVAEPAAATAPATETPVAAGQGHGSMRVLVVEDNLDAAEMLSVMLSLNGYATEIAHDGVAAIEAAQRFHPQVVLCDIGLPRMNGYEVAQQLRAMVGEFQPTLIALSGYGQDEDRRRGSAAGFDHHLVKPVEPEALFALLESLSR